MLGKFCSWSFVPSLVLLNDKMMPPNGNVRNIPTCPAQCPATHCWIGHKWKQSVCQMKLTTFHRTFLAPTGGHTGCMHSPFHMPKFVQYFAEKAIFKNKDFQPLVSTSDSVNLYTLRIMQSIQRWVEDNCSRNKVISTQKVAFSN